MSVVQVRIYRCFKEKLKGKEEASWTRDGWIVMQPLSVVLALISIGCIVGPIGGAIAMYRDNLTQLVVPPQINNLINNNNSPENINNNNSNPTDNNNNVNIGSGNFGVGENNGGFITPTFVSSQINTQARTFTVTVNFTNNFNYDLTLNALTATVESSQDNYQLGTISLSAPVTILSGQTSLITVSGIWTQDAENYVQNNFAGASSINVNLANIAIDVNGIVIQQTQPVNVGDVPLT